MAKPLIVSVKGAPTAGRPVSYTGALGSHFEFRADLARRRSVIEKRRKRSREYFASDRNGNGAVGMERDSLREEMLAALLPRDWTVVDQSLAASLRE